MKMMLFSFSSKTFWSFADRFRLLHRSGLNEPAQVARHAGFAQQPRRFSPSVLKVFRSLHLGIDPVSGFEPIVNCTNVRFLPEFRSGKQGVLDLRISMHQELGRVSESRTWQHPLRCTDEW